MGVLIAITIMTIWAGHLTYILTSVEVNFSSPVIYLHIILQAYFYTGLFITAHDAMHKTVSRNRNINNFIGTAAAFLFAGLSYKKLKTNHFKHHKEPGTEADPDFYAKSQNFFLWIFAFMKRYTTILQLLIMAIAYNILRIWIDEINLVLFWIIPAFLSTFQLFFFGTYLPHKTPHDHEMEPHKARTQKKNHLWAMISCYFFGYHFEHHDSPGTPWWKLYKVKQTS